MKLSTSQKALRQVLKRDATIRNLLEGLCEKLGVTFCFEDPQGQVLWGKRDDASRAIPMENDGEPLGTFYSADENAQPVMETPKVLFLKEWEKKK